METQLDKIHSIAEEAYLPRAGLNRKFPKAVLLEPQLYGGQGDPSLYVKKGYSQLQFLLGHIWNNDEQGKMMRQEV